MTQQPPTLSGAEHGKVRPVRVIHNGIWFTNDEGEMSNVPAALRLVGQRHLVRCEDMARQFLSERGDGKISPLTFAGVNALLYMHIALVHPPMNPTAPLVPLYPLPPGVSDDKGKVDPKIIGTLPLWGLAHGQLQRLQEEYELLMATQTPPALTHEQWERIVSEGKRESLKTLHSRHGSSALITVLHGMAGVPWPE